MSKPNRQKEYERLMDQALSSPQLGEALEVFQIAQEQYVSALSQLQVVTLSSTNSTRLGENANATLDRNQAGN